MSSRSVPGVIKTSTSPNFTVMPGAGVAEDVPFSVRTMRVNRGTLVRLVDCSRFRRANSQLHSRSLPTCSKIPSFTELSSAQPARLPILNSLNPLITLRSCPTRDRVCARVNCSSTGLAQGVLFYFLGGLGAQYAPALVAPALVAPALVASS